MKKISVLILAMVLISETYAIIPRTNCSTQTSQRVSRREGILRATGGRLLQPNSGRGIFVIANNQNLFPQKDIQNLANIIQSATMVEIKVLPSTEIISAKVLAKLNAQLGISIINERTSPTLLLAPEEGWAIVNVASLKEGKDAELNFPKRVKKEIYRAFGLLAGGCGSSYQGNLLDPIRKPEDLDLYPESDLQMPIDMLQKLPKYCEKFGIKPWRMTTYRRACQEGWAPPPKNEYQQEIWDRVHAAPKNPMKIEFDPKKGR